MDKLICVIVEDELPAAEELKYILSQNKFIYIEKMAQDGESGMKVIEEIHPHAVFMDINMPLKSGIELAKEVKKFDNTIDIIFITAYEEHAIEAFEVNALDYVLKPFDEKRIGVTIDRLINKWKAVNKEEKLPSIINEIINKIDKVERLAKKVPCERNGKIVLIDLKDIYFFYIEGEKTYIKTKDESFLIGYTLCQIQKKTNFFRAHRSYLVNIDNIKELYSWFNGTYKLVMDDIQNSEVPISRNNVKRLKELLGI